MTLKQRIAALNKAFETVKAENVKLWRENDELQQGLDELQQVYKANLIALVQKLGGCVTLPAVDVKDVLGRYNCTGERNEDGTYTLMVQPVEGGEEEAGGASAAPTEDEGCGED